ncbi:hypothetical protein U1Q18_029298 [Sarracenia purpurea var. burkii]
MPTTSSAALTNKLWSISSILSPRRQGDYKAKRIGGAISSKSREISRWQVQSLRKKKTNENENEDSTEARFDDGGGGRQG